MTLKELIDKNAIKKQEVDIAEIKGTLEVATRFLDDSEKIAEISVFDQAFIAAYSSMFHTARALLFKAGYKERNHLGLISSLGELYKDDKDICEYVRVLDKYRLTRHAIQYSGELSNELETLAIIKDAKTWLKLVKKRLKVH